MADYRLTPAALDDYREIGRYTNRMWGRAQRRAYLRDLVRCFGQIAQHPEAGRVRCDIREGLRSVVCRSHVVFYRIAGGDVEILRILHASRDIRRHL